MKTLKQYIKNLASSVGRRHPEFIVRVRYALRFHRRLNLRQPSDLNEKIQYLSLRTDTTEWSRLSDKYAVRQYVADCGLANILNTLYGVWDNADDIPFDTLPQRFVLKTTHGSGDSILVTDKSALDVAAVKATLRDTLGTTYGLAEGNLHYLRIKPRVIAEALLDNDPASAAVSTSLIDYKIWCFNGRPAYIWACTNRTKHGPQVMTYDTQWNPHPEYSIFTPHYQRGDIIPKPQNFDEMLSMAVRLSAPFPVVRVDLYNLAGRIYFGEMTFTSLGGFMNYFTPQFLRHAGSLITLPS